MDNIDWKHLLLNFDGRINRGKYFAGFGVLTVGLIVALIVVVIAATVLEFLSILALPVWVAYAWSWVAITVKRWHDRDRSGWFVLLGFVPLVNIWAWIETWFLVGTSGDNQYGPDPLQN